jgi:hypothetical protein
MTERPDGGAGASPQVQGRIGTVGTVRGFRLAAGGRQVQLWQAMSRHEGGEGVVVLPADDALLRHQHPLEEGLVHQSSHSGRAFQVTAMAVAGPSHRFSDRLLQPLKAGVGGVEQRPGTYQFLAEPLLLPLQQVQRHRPGVVRLQQLGLFVLQLLKAPGLTLPFSIHRRLLPG